METQERTNVSDSAHRQTKNHSQRTILLGGFALFGVFFVVLLALTVPTSQGDLNATHLQDLPSDSMNDPASTVHPETIVPSFVSQQNEGVTSSTSVQNLTLTSSTLSSSTTSVYENRQYKLRFSYPSSWRVHDTELGKGAFALFNFPEEQGVGKEGFGKGMTKIEVMIIRDPRSFYSTGAVVESEVAGQKAYRNVGEYNEHYSYAIELPSKPGSYVAITMYGAQENFFVLEDLLLSLEWI